jgi:hypothetical protein
VLSAIVIEIWPMPFSHPHAKGAKVIAINRPNGGVRLVLVVLTTIDLDRKGRRHSRAAIERLSQLSGVIWPSPARRQRSFLPTEREIGVANGAVGFRSAGYDDERVGMHPSQDSPHRLDPGLCLGIGGVITFPVVDYLLYGTALAARKWPNFAFYRRGSGFGGSDRRHGPTGFCSRPKGRTDLSQPSRMSGCREPQLHP